jgi:isoquinoline 1-oxidoreductase beta subunit
VKRIQTVGRRDFLGSVFSAGALVLAGRVLPLDAAATKKSATSQPNVYFQPNVYLGIEPTGRVIIVAHRSEMGTGNRTSLPMIVADELDADWKMVTVEQAIGDPRYGSQNTDGSRSVREFFDLLREAGASARMMLIHAAAQRWNVAPTACETGLHTVVHRPSGRKLGYGELATAASKVPVPKKEDVQLKANSAWRYVGKDMRMYDLADICTGKAIYGMDARIEGMVYASVEHPPVLGGKVKSCDDKEALKVAGVRQTIPIDPFKPPGPGFQPLGGVAVIADNTWAAMQGRKKLNITWDNGPNEGYNSAEYKEELRSTARQSGRVVRKEGNVNDVFAKATRVIEAEYYVPLLAQAPMEPEAAVADFRDGTATIWTCTQNPQAVQTIVSTELGIPKENVICHVTLLGGGFGRKSKPDYVAEAAVLSKKMGRPVKVIWSREDDIKFGYYNAVAAMYMKAAVGEKGRPNAWLQRSVFPPIPSIYDVNAVYGDPGHLGQGWTDIPFDIPNLLVENGPAKAHVRIGWLRSVANIYHAFAVQSFADELAHQAGRDPVEYLLELIGRDRILDLKNTRYENYGASYDVYPVDTARLRRVTEMVCEKAQWGKRKSGHRTGFGIAAHRSFLTYVATVVEVEVTDRGEVHIPRVDTVVDAGTIVNPDLTRAQFEGAVVFGTSVARTGEITATKGVIDQSNFNNYPVARINEVPRQTNVYLVDSTAPPAGVGEPGVPPFIAAFCNAIFAATGKRIRDLPIGKQKLV